MGVGKQERAGISQCALCKGIDGAADIDRFGWRAWWWPKESTPVPSLASVSVAVPLSVPALVVTRPIAKAELLLAPAESLLIVPLAVADPAAAPSAASSFFVIAVDGRAVGEGDEGAVGGADMHVAECDRFRRVGGGLRDGVAGDIGAAIPIFAEREMQVGEGCGEREGGGAGGGDASSLVPLVETLVSVTPARSITSLPTSFGSRWRIGAGVSMTSLALVPLKRVVWVGGAAPPTSSVDPVSICSVPVPVMAPWRRR